VLRRTAASFSGHISKTKKGVRAPLREILTAVAVLFIVALLAAIIGPRFINWNGQRAYVEAELSERLNIPVRIDGDLRILLLPTPSFTAENVKVGGRDGPVSLEASALSAYFSPQALLQGRVQVTEMTLQSPRVSVAENIAANDAGGDIAIDFEKLRHIGIERLVIADGAVRKADARQDEFLIAGIDATIVAPSLAGAIRGNGSFALDGRRPTVRFSTGEPTREKLGIDLLVEDAGAGIKFESQGILRLATTEAGPARSYDATISASGNVDLGAATLKSGLPWRAAAKARFTAAETRLDALEMAMGPRLSEVTLKGKALFDVKTRSLTGSLQARQINADSLFGLGEPKRISPGSFVARVQELMQAAFAAGTLRGEGETAIKDWRIDLSTEAITVGAEQITEVAAIFDSRAGSLGLSSLSAKFPGNASLSFKGTTEKATGLEGGKLAIDAPDVDRLARWLGAPALSETGLKSFSLGGALTFDDVRLSVSEAELSTNGIAWTGRIGWTPADSASHPNGLIELALAAEQVDFDRLPSGFGGSGSSVGLPNFDVELSVRKFVLEGGSFGGVTLDAEQIGDRLSIKQLAIDDFGGATVTARGELTPNSDALEAQLKASDLRALSALASRIMPGTIADWFRKTAPHMAPADATISLTSSANEAGGSRNRSLTATGTLGVTKARVSGLWRDSVGLLGSPSEPSSIGISLDSAEGTVLLNQIGITTHAPPIGKTSMLINARGSIASGFDVEMASDADIGRASVNGRLVLTAPAYPLTGQLTLNAFDLGRIAKATQLDPDFLPEGRSAYITGTLYGSTSKLLITDLSAQVADSEYKGELAFHLSKGGQIAGQIRTPNLDLSPVLAIPFGRWPRAKEGEVWARTQFGPSDPPVLSGDLWIEAGALRLAPDLDLNDARFVLRFDKNMLNFEHSDARLAGGRISGDVFMRRAEQAVQVSSRLELKDIALNRITPLGADARISGAVEGSAVGLSPASLVGSLAGGGEIVISNIILDGLDTGALDRVAKQGMKTFSELGGQALAGLFEQELAKAPLRIDQAKMPVSIAAGTVRVGPSKSMKAGIALEGFGTADLETGALEARLAMASSTLAPELGEKPEAAVSWAGSISGVKRRTDFGAFTAALTDRAIEIEQEQAKAFEDDIKERAMFNRRLKADRARIKAEREAKLFAERDAAIRREGERVRLHFERIRLEAEARRQRTEALQEFRREAERAAGRTSPVTINSPARNSPVARRKAATPETATPAEVKPLELLPEDTPIDLTPPQPTQ
jgi:hypothetical protein